MLIISQSKEFSISPFRTQIKKNYLLMARVKKTNRVYCWEQHGSGAGWNKRLISLALIVCNHGFVHRHGPISVRTWSDSVLAGNVSCHRHHHHCSGSGAIYVTRQRRAALLSSFDPIFNRGYEYAGRFLVLPHPPTPTLVNKLTKQISRNHERWLKRSDRSSVVIKEIADENYEMS